MGFDEQEYEDLDLDQLLKCFADIQMQSDTYVVESGWRSDLGVQHVFQEGKALLTGALMGS